MVIIRKIPLNRVPGAGIFEIRGMSSTQHEVRCLLRMPPLIHFGVISIDMKSPTRLYSQWSTKLLGNNCRTCPLFEGFSCKHVTANSSVEMRPILLLTKSYSSGINNERRGGNTIVENRKTEENTQVSTSVVENIKETTKTISYTGVFLVVLGIAAAIIYTIISELFSSKSPHRIYSKTFKYISQEPKVQNLIGDQIKGFGEETRRGRRQHVSHIEYSKDGRNYLRMKFYIKGSRGHGSVHLEMVENDTGEYEYRYLFIVVDSDPSIYKKTLILEDNRNKYDQGNSSTLPELNSRESLKEIDLSLK